jgi:predicted phage replisome organizer
VRRAFQQPAGIDNRFHARPLLFGGQLPEKHFYWLKLQTSFFDSDEVKVIEQMENGSKYIVFWLKLLLKAVAQSDPGQLRFKKGIPYTPELLSTITGTDIDIVRSAIQLFDKLGMIRMAENGDIWVDSVKSMCGSETKWAEYKRRERLDNVQQISNSRPTELELEKELEKKEPYARIGGAAALLAVHEESNSVFHDRKAGEEERVADIVARVPWKNSS